MIDLLLAAVLLGQTTVRNDQELRDATRAATAGTRILVAPGEYRPFSLANLRGTAAKPVVIAGADPKDPPVFRGGATGLHATDVEHLELADLVFDGATGNGVNIDDGGTPDTPTRHVVLRRLQVRNVGARGNQDGLKLSGVDDFKVEECTVERWGGNGSGIDMVGCHRGVIERCTFRHTDGVGSNAVQMKGGSSGIAVRRCRFETVGSRAINIGGSTGLEYFRPPLVKPPHAEARAIVVEGNTFIGSDAPIAFVGVDGAIVRFNTIYAPRRWAIRILQETTAPGFAPCRGGEFSRNIVAFLSTQWSEGGVNVGGGTDPKSFAFSANFWCCVDDPARSRPRLPTDERDGVYGTDPRFRDAEKGDLRLQPGSKAAAYGAEALK